MSIPLIWLPAALEDIEQLYQFLHEKVPPPPYERRKPLSRAHVYWNPLPKRVAR